MAFETIFKTGAIGSMRIKNRLVMPPMVRNYADAKGFVTPRYVDHIERVARGGVGTIVLEASFIHPDGKGFMNQLGIHADATVPGLKKLVAAAHRHGAVIGPQLYHAGRQTSAKTTGHQPVAPSPIPDPSSGEMPRELSAKEIRGLVGMYAKGAARAKKAGCDFVELHGAHGYLITQFLSPFGNRRDDAYGGTAEKRMRFLLEVYAAVRAEVGPAFPITLRLSGDELVAGGLRIKDTIAICKRMEKEGVDAFHISAGNYVSYPRGKMIPPMAVEDGVLLPLAAAVKKAVKVPVIAVAKIRTAEMAQKALKDGTADFVAIGRTLLADPEWPNKVKSGRVAEISRCIACNQGCISRLFAQQDIWCTVNPATGRERLFASKPKRKKRVVIVGGGPAGMSAAKTAAERGHAVVLFEKERRLGGQLWAASETPHRDGWEELREDLVAAVGRLGVDVRLNVEFTPALLKREKADAVILAIGSTSTRPKIPGVGRTNVVVARDILEGKAKVEGERMVVAGGGCMGAQTAEYLAERGHRVTIVEATGSVAVDAPVDDRALLLGRLAKLKVKLLTETKIMGIGPGSVTIENHGGSKALPADTVVLCLGSFPNDGLAAECRAIVRNVAVVGDAKEARRVTDAVAEGALAAVRL
ncbi:MAG TPA: FAD-dependent oxidoreductase [Patescibacteria group bacterium]|nr:FAD-dependent oxidoreductase [Patescibacteria group bacterium]